MGKEANANESVTLLPYFVCKGLRGGGTPTETICKVVAKSPVKLELFA